VDDCGDKLQPCNSQACLLLELTPAVTIQIVPAEVGTHAGLLGGFFVGNFDDTPVIVYAETAVEGITIDKPALVSKAAQGVRAAAVRGPAPRRLPRPDQESC
jgi:Domain of unknown function (DUF5753)